jgi:hypothetical protein
VDPAKLADNPGLYTLKIEGDTGSPTLEVTVVTPDAAVQLAEKERAALAGVAAKCCGGKSGKSPFCSQM